MGYVDQCTSCYGSGEGWEMLKGGKTRRCPCRRCRGSGKVKAYRRHITLSDSHELGYDKIPPAPRRAPDGQCVVCNAKLTGRKQTFCSEDCRRGFLWRVWKAAHWQKRAIADRDGAACRACGEVFESPIRAGGPLYPEFALLQLDHIKPLHKGGDERPENCQLLCKPCHQLKTTRERTKS